MVKVRCKECTFFEAYSIFMQDDDERENPEEGTSGSCNWMRGQLPHSFRYASREVMGVYSLEQIECAQFVSVQPIVDELTKFAKDNTFSIIANGKIY